MTISRKLIYKRKKDMHNYYPCKSIQACSKVALHPRSSKILPHTPNRLDRHRSVPAQRRHRVHRLKIQRRGRADQSSNLRANIYLHLVTRTFRAIDRHDFVPGGRSPQCAWIVGLRRPGHATVGCAMPFPSLASLTLRGAAVAGYRSVCIGT